MIPQKHRILYEKRNVTEWEQVLQILDENDIPYTIQNSGMQDIFGSAGIGASYLSATGSPAILIEEADYESAADLLLEIISPSELPNNSDSFHEETSEENVSHPEPLESNTVSGKMLIGLILTVIWVGGLANIIAVAIFLKMIKKLSYLGIVALILNGLILFFTFRWYFTLLGTPIL